MTAKSVELKQLEKENTIIRDKIKEYIPISFETDVFNLINKLINNEIAQEELCGE